MRLRSLLLGAVTLAGAAAMAPRPASAQGAPPPPAANLCAPNVYTVQLGIGGALFGCMQTVTAQQLFENAAFIDYLYWFKNMPPLDGGGAPIPLPTPANFLFDDEANGTGNDGGKYFCNAFGQDIGGPCAGTKIMSFLGTNTTDELVFGLNTPQAPPAGPTGVWEYSGANDGRNAIPAPQGFQAILLRNTDVVNQYVLVYEDLNSSCMGANPNPTTITNAQLANRTFLTMSFHNCGGVQTGDQDFNDFYVVLNVPGGILAPEPASMSLLALGLAGLAGAGARRRKRRS